MKPMTHADIASATAEARSHHAVPVGIAISPAVESALRRDGFLKPGSREIPVITDPRLTHNSCEVYTDFKAWQKRCEEQRLWDATQIMRNQQP